jgi:ubiquinone biosynthesis protein UbiJ
MMMEYWTEEQPLLAKPSALHEFIREVDALKDETARLEQRISALIVK